MQTNYFILMHHELIIAITIMLLLVIKVGSDKLSNQLVANVTNGLLLASLILGFIVQPEGNVFGDMFHTDGFALLQKNILVAGTLIISLQASTWLKDYEHTAEFYILLLSTLLGMCFMISSRHFLMFYLSLELSTIPLAALANFDLHLKRSSEAALKLIISSAFSSGLMLLGISFLYGTTGTLSFGEVASAIQLNTPLQLFAFVLIFAGFGFKISAVPFHLWTADVYEGSPVAVTSYLSVISKGAVLFVFITVLFNVFALYAHSWYYLIVIVSLFTMVVGNLFALRQTNIKRFLAFSSISQVGFILIGLSGGTHTSAASVVYFIVVYIFSNLGAFGVIALVQGVTGKENINDYKGFYLNNKMLSWMLGISLFSLAGIPPVAGFFGKFFLLLSGAEKGAYWLIAIAAINMVISLYYYLNVVKNIFIDKSDTSIEKLPIAIQPRIAMIICVIGVVGSGLCGGLYQYIYQLVK